MGKALMVQGTASHVGKSVLVAGLCRVFRQEGLRVAPFKAQNMALNSFATPDGREIGRAQAVQAEAAGIAPAVRMNPILLKPEGHARSQVIVEGRVWGVMDAATYQLRKEELWPVVESSLAQLLAEYDLVVIEGAGSPVEVNLKASDIVNMRVALAANAPVLLVADIDRGGVFAALVGTMELLEPQERALVAGFIINKFRGDPELFRSGTQFLNERLGRPVAGLVPWVEDLGIAEEDSQGLPFSGADQPESDAVLDVVVIRLPHIANFDDFDPLARRAGVRLRYVDRVDAFGRPDLVLMPGTKMTRSDLGFVRERGLDGCIAAHAQRGGAVVGICGGYQMLGARLDDPEGVEGPAGSCGGLGLLPVVTHFGPEKATVQVRARIESQGDLFRQAKGQTLSAYEIHMGRTNADSKAPFVIVDPDGYERPDGAEDFDGRVLGTYLHGLFHNPDLLEAMLGVLATAKDARLPPPTTPHDPYDRVAAVLRRSLDIEMLRSLVENGQSR